jgi:hypothetical protein
MQLALQELVVLTPLKCIEEEEGLHGVFKRLKCMKGLVTRHRFQVGVREPLSQSGPLLSDTPFGAYVAL